MKIQNTLSFQAFSMALPLFMKEEGLSSFSIHVSSDGEEACIDFGLPPEHESQANQMLSLFLEKLDDTEKLLVAMRTIAKMKKEGVKEKEWKPFLTEAEEKKKKLYGDSISGTIDESLFRDK